MSWQPAPAAGSPGTTPSRPGRTMIWIGVVTLVVSIVLGVVAIVQVVNAVGRPLADAMQNPAYETPADFSMRLDAVQYTVYASTTGGRASIGADDVTVTAEGGGEVEVRAAGDELESIARGSTEYVGAVRFTPTAAGEHQIQVAEQPDALVVVAPSIEPNFEELGAWVIAGFLAGIGSVVGLVLLIVGLVRRSSARKQPALGGYPYQPYQGGGYPDQPYGQQHQPQHQPQRPPQPQEPLPHRPEPSGQQLPPAGWYPDPGGSGQSRYWDGSSWTDHQR